MIPANQATRNYDLTRMLVLVNGKSTHSNVGSLIDFLDPGDLIVVNHSATLPASFRGVLDRTQESVEIRLAAFQGPDPQALRSWLAFSFGAGEWRIPTEHRGLPPTLRSGDVIEFGPDLSARALNVHANRLLQIEFEGESIAAALYKYGRPIQYSYHLFDLQVWDQQTIFSGPPISVEPPSAGFPFSWDNVFKLRQKGIQFASILHSAGLSSTGSKSLDELLPLPEWFEVSQLTASLVNETKRKNKRIVALGTTVLRALESALDEERQVIATSGITSLKIQANHQIHSVTSLITGMHELGTSHRKILGAFSETANIQAGYMEAETLGYRDHEYGDISFLDAKKSDGIGLAELRIPGPL